MLKDRDIEHTNQHTERQTVGKIVTLCWYQVDSGQQCGPTYIAIASRHRMLLDVRTRGQRIRVNSPSHWDELRKGVASLLMVTARVVCHCAADAWCLAIPSHEKIQTVLLFWHCRLITHLRHLAGFFISFYRPSHMTGDIDVACVRPPRCVISYRNACIHRQTFFAVCYGHHSRYLSLNGVTKFRR